MKKSILLGITIMALLSFIGTAAPAGICLHATSPEAPLDKIQCFEYERVERVGENVRFFLSTGRSVMVTAFRFRGLVPYKPDLSPTHPDFDKLLKLYEETARSSPSTGVHLNPKILVMRSQAAGLVKQAENMAKLLTITLADGSQLRGCTMTKIENGFVSIRHQDGVSKVKLKDLDAKKKKELNDTTEDWSLDDPSITSKNSSGTFAKIVFKNGRLIKNAKFKEVSEGNLIFLTNAGNLSIPADQFPGELSVLGEDAVKLLTQSKNKSMPESSADRKPIESGIQPEGQGGDNKQEKQLASKAEQLFKQGLQYQYFERERLKGEATLKNDVSKKNINTALGYFLQAGELGNAEAHYYAALCYARLGDLNEYIRCLTRSADQGLPKAQYVLGMCYLTGEGVEKNDKTAQSLFRKSAFQGSSDGQCELGNCYAQGLGIEGDQKIAVEWYLKSAEQGNRAGQYWLGFSYQLGNGVEKNSKTAAEWYSKSALQDDKEAQLSLAHMYMDGDGVPKDPVIAYMLFVVSEPAVKAAYDKNKMENLKDKVLSADEISLSQKMIERWQSIPNSRPSLLESR